MTGTEIAALAEAGLQLIAKVVELIQAASKGDIGAAEALKSLTDHTTSVAAAKDELRDYLDEKFDNP